MKTGNGSPNVTKEAVINHIKLMTTKGLERRKLAYDTLKRVEQIKEEWKQSEKKWSKEFKENIIRNLFS